VAKSAILFAAGDLRPLVVVEAGSMVNTPRHDMPSDRDLIAAHETARRLGAELDEAIAQLRAVTNVHAWTQPHQD